VGNLALVSAASTAEAVALLSVGGVGATFAGALATVLVQALEEPVKLVHVEAFLLGEALDFHEGNVLGL